MLWRSHTVCKRAACFIRCWYRHNSNTVRVRFAPSPTGQLHLGGLRTALYNYLFAKSHDGSFVLRVEDTDQTRCIPGAMERLVDMLQWVGIHADEGPFQGGDFGPYIQSKRSTIYWEMVDRLIQNGTAYYCFCTPKRLQLLRKEALRSGETPKYDNRCRHLTDRQIEENLKSSTPYVIRFKLEEYKEPWEDLVYGPITSDVASIEGDPVLLKTDRYPTYHFANVVDDHLMKITHVLRGVEWQVSTTKHVLLYKAFGWDPPKFAHLPLLLNKDGTKLSKRQNDINVEYFKNNGCFPDALLNLLTGMGSGFTISDTKGMTLDELIKHFDLSELKTNSTRIEISKMEDYNRHHLERLLQGPVRSSVISQVRDMLKEHYKDRLENTIAQEEILSDDYIGTILDWIVPRISVLKDILSPDLQFLWLVSPSGSRMDLIDDGNVIERLETTIEQLTNYPGNSFTRDSLAQHWKSFAKVKKWKFAPYMQLLRFGISGLKEGPSVAEMMSVLGKENTIKRLQHALQRIQHT